MFPSPFHLRLLLRVLLVSLILVGATNVHAQRLSERAQAQIAALLAEKSRRTPVQARLDSQLVYLLKRQAGNADLAALPELQPALRTETDGRLLVDVRGDITPGLERFVTGGGGQIVASVPRFGSLRARLVPAQLETLAARPEVRFIEPAVQAETNLGPVLSGGDTAHLAASARTAFGVDGTGLKIGVLSDGADSLTLAKTAGELNARARSLDGQAGAGDEGTAMMEIVQDLLPGAELLFATAFNGDASFASNILSLQAAGCSIIVDDVTYFNESPFQDMVIAQAVNTVSNAGVLFFSSAGNSGNQNDGTSGVWEGDFLAGGVAGAPLTTAGTLHDFGGGLTYNTATGGNSRRVDLFWADPTGASANDYDLFILNSTGTSVLRSSTNLQTGSQNPYESVGTLNLGERIVIVQKPGAANRYLHLSTGRGVLSVSTDGQTRGHNASGAANAFCVAAVRTSAPASPASAFNTDNTVETFSSDGPRRMFYQPDGTPFTPGNFSASGGLLLAKPDLTAANGVATSVPGFTTFYGTSASAPHAAAIAGLLQAYNPDLSAAEIRALLNASALDIEAAGTDRDSGVGIVMAEAALSAAAAPDALRIAGAGLVATGAKGGPFTSSGGSHTLTNNGASPLDWTATPDAAWISVSPAAGSLAPGASTVVTVALEPAATGLAGGQHQASLAFRNTGSGFERALSVHLNAAFDPFPDPIAGSGTGLVPDGVASTPPAPGAPLTVSIPVSGLTETVSRVAVSLTLSHAWAGDLEAVLTSPGGSRSLVLFSRIGATAAADYGSGSAFNGTYIFTDSATGPNLWTAASSSPVAPGLYRSTAAGGAGQTNPAPVTSLDATFGGLTPAEANGIWTLSFRDYCAPDQGTVTAAALSFSPIAGLSTNNRLANLSTNAGSLDPNFDADTERYALTVPAGTTSLRLTATAEDPGALIDLGLHGAALLPVSSGSPSPAIPLVDGLNLLDLQVTAANGLVRTYRLAVTRQGDSPILTVPTRLAWDRGLNVPLRSDPWTMQFVYARDLLRYLPPGTKIQGLSFRLWIGASTWPPDPRNWGEYSVELSAATRPAGELSATFADNVGADAVTARSGALTVATGAYPGGDNPNAFGPVLHFDSPYVYQGGDLLITLRHSGSGGGDFAYIETLPSQEGWFECLAAEGQSATAAVYTADTPVLQLNFELPQPEITLSGNAVAIASGDTTPSADDHTDFGSVRLDGDPFSRSFTLSNSGEATLDLGELDLEGDADFTLLAPLPDSLAPGASTTFSLVFTPTALGDRSAVVAIASDDADENPFTFTVQGRGIAPEIGLSGNAVAIASGDTTPSADDHTDFGSVRLDGDPFSRSFTLSNSGEATLDLGELDLEGDADFTLLAPLPDSLAPGASTTFSLVFTPTALGDRSAVVAIASDDADENPFTFTVQGRGIAPEIGLSGNAVAIASGDTTPSADDHTDFGSVRLDGEPFSRSFTLSNTGEATLHLSGASRVEVTGPHAEDFEILLEPSSPLEPGASTTFTLACRARLPGERRAEVRIASDDPTTPEFRFTVRAFGQLPQALAQNLTFDPPKVIYLSQSPLALLATASSGRPVLLEVVAGPGVLTDNLLQVQEAGVIKLRASQAGGGNDAPATPVLRSITVKPDPNQLTLIDLVQVYDGTPREVRVLGTDGPVTLTYKIAGVEGSEAPVNAGKYAVKARAGTRTKAGTLTVLKAPLWVTPEDARRFAGQANPAFTAEYRGFVEGEDEAVLQSLPVLTTRAKASSPGGFYAITSKGGTAANYELRHGAGTLFVETFGSTWAALLRDGDRPAGRVEIVLNAANTSFSAKLQHAASALPLALAGPLTLDADAERTSGSARLEKNGQVCQLDFTLDLDGRLSAEATCDGLALQADDGRRLRAKSAGDVEHAGVYTVLLEPALPAADDVPGGAGWARAGIDDNGLMSLAGSLGDGTRFTASVPSDEAGDPGYLLFLQPYQPARAGAYLGGAFTLQPHPALAGRRHVPEAVLAWDKVGLAKDTAYPEGFSGRDVVLLLDPWLKPARGESLAPRLGLTGNSLRIEHDTSAATADLPSLLQLGSRNLIVLEPAANPTQWKASLKTDSGLLSGSWVRLVDGKKQTLKWTGLLRQPSLAGDVLIGAGHFLLPNSGTGQTTGEVRFLKPEE